MLLDYQIAQKLVLNRIFYRRSKFMDISYHFVRKSEAKKFVKISYLQAAKMPGIRSKSLSSIRQER